MQKVLIVVLIVPIPDIQDGEIDDGIYNASGYAQFHEISQLPMVCVQHIGVDDQKCDEQQQLEDMESDLLVVGKFRTLYGVVEHGVHFFCGSSALLDVIDQKHRLFIDGLLIINKETRRCYLYMSKRISWNIIN